MNKKSNTTTALNWITDILNRLEIPYQVVGGLAAKCYGSTRPLHDIDFYVSAEAISTLEEELNDFIEFGPKHYKDSHWDLIFMRIRYNGQQMEFADADHTKYFDSQSGQWINENINFSESNLTEYEDVGLPIVPKKKLIKYKRRLHRKVDRIDIACIQKRNHM